MRKVLGFLSITTAIMGATDVTAENIATGQIVVTEGHTNPACRQVWLRQADGTTASFRMPNTGVEDGIMAVTLTALTTGLTVAIHYFPNVGSGCGTEPVIDYIDIKQPGF